MSYVVAKRGMDIAISALACLVLLPVFVILMLVIALESPGSPIFVQTRIGQYGRTFSMFKFRSMVKNAPALGTWYTTQNDPRITRIGRFIRATSLDELPQLWNVLLGDMSLIGPRPDVPAQEAQYRPEEWEARHRVRPGITGLAQVSGRSALTHEDQLRLDLAYAGKPTLRMDLEIVLKTISIVLWRTGVN